jgi:hypothetical protein
LRDEREDLRLAIGEALAAPGPVEPDDRPRSRRCLADDDLPVGDRLDGDDEVVRRERLGEVAAGAICERNVDESGM